MKPASLIASAAFAASLTLAADSSVHFLEKPAMNKSEIVFSYAGDLWTVPRSGGVASRLSSGIGFETEPAFSPDGSTIAFTGEYDGNVDVFTVPAGGGVPKRITYHPDADRVAGWTPDGKRILFRSNRDSFSRFTQLYTVDANGGFAELLPLPMACTGAYSPDGNRMVYAPLDGGQFATGFTNFVSWKRYRGGEASYLWLVNFSDLGITKVPRTDSNDINPMWIGDKIYFLSDRQGPMTLWMWDGKSKEPKKVIENTGKDISSASAGPGGIVYEQFGGIYIYDLATNKSTKVDVQIAADLAEVRPHFQNVSREIRNAAVSPNGVRAVFEAHGEILTVPAEKGDIRNLTNTPGVMERTPSWSPDGKSVAYFSDESGEYALHIKPQSGEGDAKKIPLAGNSAFYFDPKWSPDSKHIAFSDNELNLWDVEIASAKLTKIDTDLMYVIGRDISWSGDSKWIAFTKFLPNHFHAIELYSVESGKTTQVTDGMSDARFPAFDRDGQYLYFTASTNYGPTISGLDMTSDEHEVNRSVYLLVLANNVASPLASESDEEKPGEPAPSGGGRGGRGGANGADRPAEPPKAVRIDFDGLSQRIVALPIPARSYFGLEAGKAGIFYILEAGAGFRGGAGGFTLSKWDMKTRKLDKLADNVQGFELAANGDKMLLRMAAPGVGGRGGRGGAGTEAPAPNWVIAPANAPVKPGEGALRIASMQVRVDPPAEWKQMYHEVWRIERSYFYDPNLHGVNAADFESAYEKYLDALSSRADLNYLIHDFLSEFTVGHLRGGGGTIPEPRRVQGGLLGADFEIANNRYRIRKIYTGELWNPNLHGPLSEPGLNVKPGDYILSIGGQDLVATEDISRLLEGTANKPTRVKIGGDPSGAGSREITVTPVGSEAQLRHEAWVEGNRRKVDELSGGKLAYVYMPDTAQGGLTSFTRYYFAQTDKQGAVIDERYNGGGQVADYVINVLNRPLMGWWSPRWGQIYRTPAAQVFGPKVMIINEFAGSGGDAMPWMFRHAQTGTLVGKRTWGGLVGVSGYPALMDGGNVTAPSFGFFNPKGEWDVENHGTPPDVEVDQDPKSVHEGHDPQLERAVAIALKEMESHPVPKPNRPPFPNYQNPQRRPATATSPGVRHQ